MTSARMTVRMVAMLVLALALVVLQPAVEVGAQKPVNHLAGAQSPYLRMHVNDPVDWYPWSPEALAKARRENKPIFHQAMRYGDIGRERIRRETIATALEMLRKMMA